MNDKEIPEELANAQEADWIREMRQHFNETGEYRAEDLNRLLGDPTRGVELSPDPTTAKQAFFSQVKLNTR